MTHTITGSALDSLEALAKMKEGTVSQDGQVTILDLQKHMAYLIWKFLLSECSDYNSPSPISNGNFQPHSQQKWLAREYNSHGLDYFLCPYQ